MVLNSSTDKAAQRMGQRAGEHLRDYGIPTRNPFPDTQAQLAQAWRDAYLTHSRPAP